MLLEVSELHPQQHSSMSGITIEFFFLLNLSLLQRQSCTNCRKVVILLSGIDWPQYMSFITCRLHCIACHKCFTQGYPITATIRNECAQVDQKMLLSPHSGWTWAHVHPHPVLLWLPVAVGHLCSNTTDVLVWMDKRLQHHCLIHLTLADKQFWVRFPTKRLQTLQSEEDTTEDICKVVDALLGHLYW